MLTLKKYFEGGFSLPEIMIAMGIMGGISLVTLKIMEENTGNEAFLKASGEVSKTASTIEAAINNPALCTAMFAGKTRNASTTSGDVIYQLQYPVNGGVKIILQDNATYGDFKIFTGDMQLSSSTIGPNIVQLIINFSIRNRTLIQRGDDSNPASFKVIKKIIPFVATLNGTTIRSCGPVLSDENSTAAKTLCLSLGSATTWNGTSCALNNTNMRCPWGKIPSSMTDLGNITCVPIENQLKLDDLFDLSSVNCVGKPNLKIESVPSGGQTKLKVNCY